MSTRRVVVTGMGAVTPLGPDVPTLWSALTTGRSGIRKIKSFDTTSFDTKIAGEVQDFDPTRYFDRKDARRYMTLSFRADLKQGWFLDAAAQRDTNRSKFPAAVSTTVPPDDITDYTENQVQVGLGYDFGSAPSAAGRPRTPTD